MRQGLGELWGMLDAQGMLMAALVERRDGQTPPLAFGFSVFVTDDFLAAAGVLNRPWLTALLLKEHGGAQSPVLDAGAVRRGNEGTGLSLLNLLYVFDDDVRDPAQALLLRRELNLAFNAVHRGFRLREILGQGYAEDMPFLLKGGWYLRREYGAYYRRGDVPQTPPGKWLSLIGMARDEAVADGFSSLAMLFHAAPPRLGLRPGEQTLLVRALDGQTDEELALGLNLSLSAVKKRWNGVYARVASADPTLLPVWAPEEVWRGAEKRRHLLQYLRDHPEELRPALTR